MSYTFLLHLGKTAEKCCRSIDIMSPKASQVHRELHCGTERIPNGKSDNLVQVYTRADGHILVCRSYVTRIM